MTDPAGTVMLDAVVIAPTVRPAPVIAAVAAACVWLTTSGTATCGRPDEMTSATALPMSTSAPAAGFWLITDPAGTVSARRRRDRADRQAAAVIAAVAAACGRFDDVRHRDVRQAGRDDQRHRAAGRRHRRRRRDSG